MSQGSGGRRWPVREIAQVGFIAVLVVSAIVTGRTVEMVEDDNDALRGDVRAARAVGVTNAAAVESVESILADVCAAAPAKRLDNAGVDKECALAEAGNIEDRLPVVERNPGGPGVSVAQVEGVVDAYLDRYLADLPDDYTAELRTQVVDYLRANPPAGGRRGEAGDRGRRGRAGVDVTDTQVAAAVAAYVQANPPPAGEAGVGVSAAFLDGCDVVFTYTDGSTSRVGPLCGPQGPQGDKGDKGDTGAQGEPGRGVVDMECIDENPDDPASRWRITYSNGAVDENAGPCRGPKGAPGEQGPPGPTPQPPPPSSTPPPELGVP